MSVQLVLVPLRFFRSVSCSWRPFWGSPAGCLRACCRYIGIFWASPAPLACWGSWGFAPGVRVFLLRCCLLGLQVRFPCCLSLTLEWVYFWLRCLQSLWAPRPLSVGPSPFSGVGVDFGHALVAPRATPGFGLF